MGRLAGAVALVTGAARGQGEGIARRFVAEGARVVLSDILDDQGKAVAASLGEGSRYLRLDVRREEDWATGVRSVVEEFGRLTVLINNAGVHVKQPMEEMPVDDYLDVMATNQLGCWLGMRAAAPAMRAAGGGVIVNTASIAGLRGLPTRTAYCASKWAVRGMTRAAAVELGPGGIRVNAVLPGAIDTAMAAGGDHSGQPVPRIGQVEEVAELMVYLASPESAFCTGADFVIDGGSSAGLR